eukprot:PhF_6_TR42699/c0_g1_i2/m.64471
MVLALKLSSISPTSVFCPCPSSQVQQRSSPSKSTIKRDLRTIQQIGARSVTLKGMWKKEFLYRCPSHRALPCQVGCIPLLCTHRVRALVLPCVREGMRSGKPTPSNWDVPTTSKIARDRLVARTRGMSTISVVILLCRFSKHTQKLFYRTKK